MQSTLKKLVDYLEETLGVAVAPRPWEAQRLPYFLKKTYRFKEIDLLDRKFLLMLDSRVDEQAPAVTRKHIGLVQPRWNAEIIYVRPQLTGYNRKRLVQQKVPFIVPGNQMYLPTLGIDFREYFKQLHAEPEVLSPSAQVLLLHVLLRSPEDVVTPKEAAARLGYSAMSMTRAFNGLEATGIADVSMVGKERHLRLITKPQATWTQAQSFLRSPVKKRVHIQHVEATEPRLRAGLTALAEYTMLAPPTRATNALNQEDWASLQLEHKVVEVPYQDPEALEIEVWSYSPALFAIGDLVDPLSLYLALRDSDDERIAASLEELMETIKW